MRVQIHQQISAIHFRKNRLASDNIATKFIVRCNTYFSRLFAGMKVVCCRTFSSQTGNTVLIALTAGTAAAVAAATTAAATAFRIFYKG